MNTLDIEGLAYRAMGKTEDQADEAINNGDINVAIHEQYNCSFDTYCQIVNDLIKFTPLLESPLTGTKFHAFVDVEQQRAIVKMVETTEHVRNKP